MEQLPVKAARASTIPYQLSITDIIDKEKKLSGACEAASILPLVFERWMEELGGGRLGRPQLVKRDREVQGGRGLELCRLWPMCKEQNLLDFGQGSFRHKINV